MHDFLIALSTGFLLRWTLANVAGWSAGLYLGSALVGALGGIGGALAGGVLAGAVVGAAQWIVLRTETQAAWANPRWAIASALGGGLAILPAYIAGAALIAGPQVGYFVVGGVYGGIFGALQGFLFRTQVDHMAVVWVTANLLAGGLCGCLTMTASLPGMPLICSPGPVVFGLVTGCAAQMLQRDS